MNNHITTGYNIILFVEPTLPNCSVVEYGVTANITAFQMGYAVARGSIPRTRMY